MAVELLASQRCFGFEPGAGADWTDSSEFKGRKFRLGPWTGDNFARGHALRDAEVPHSALETNRAVDVVVVGGGLAGLTAAHYLRDHDFLLLEQYAEVGGQSRGSTRQGVDFSFGAAFIRPPENEIAELLADLDLKPVKFDTSRHSWHAGDRCFVGVSSDSGSANSGISSGGISNSGISSIRSGTEKCYAEFRSFEQESKPIWELIGSLRGVQLPPELKKLDEKLFASSINSYSPEFVSLVDTILRTSNCLGVDKISALAGYMSMQDIFEPCYSFQGGNSAITRALAKRLSASGNSSNSSNSGNPRDPSESSNSGESSSSRIVCDTFVWSMDVTESGVNIIYSDGAGHMHGVQAKHAIVTVPPMVAARILKNLDNASKAAMLAFRYGSYLVANCFFSKAVYGGSFSNWYSSPAGFSNILEATEIYRREGLYTKDMGQVLTIYQPYLPGSEGRTLLLEGDRTKLSRGILDQLAPISNQLEASLDSIVLSRWGHAMPVMNVGYFARMARLISMAHSNFSLSHSSSQGLQCAESAVSAARLAVNHALKVKTKAKPLIFFDTTT